MKSKHQQILRPQPRQSIPSHAKKVLKGVIFEAWQWEQELPDGSTTTFERILRRDSVVTFPILNDGRIVLTKQEQPRKKLFIAAPGGRINPGEEVLDAAKRELLEEAGIKVQRFILWKAVQPTSEIDWASYVFVAKDISEVADSALDPGEKVELLHVSFDELLEIATQDDFYEMEIQVDVFRTLLDSEKMTELRDLFDPAK
jgi:ADP-ribose diphosphatase